MVELTQLSRVGGGVGWGGVWRGGREGVCQCAACRRVMRLPSGNGNSGRLFTQLCTGHFPKCETTAGAWRSLGPNGQNQLVKLCSHQRRVDFLCLSKRRRKFVTSLVRLGKNSQFPVNRLTWR